MRHILLLVILLISEHNQKIIDRSSYSDINKVQTKHLNLSLEVDFNNKEVFGHVQLNMQRHQNVSYVDLDMIGIEIQTIQQYINKQKVELKYNIDTPHEILGSRLRVFIVQSDFKQESDSLILIIYYKTLNNKDQRSINWLEPSQTSGKLLPYMFTQCESINCRSLIPLQDSPSSKLTYTAQIIASQNFNVQMSAYLQSSSPLSNNKTLYHFNQPIPIPSYLIALAVGDFHYQKIGKRTGVIAEKQQLQQAAQCLSDLDLFLDKAEDVFGEYSWANYTILVLPPSFPFGGMENPFMTFASPTIITEDKQQVFVAIHEIMHSWFGNQVTMRNWTDFWLNEGFTVFAERTVSGLLFGSDFRKIQSQIGLVGLTQDETNFGLNNSYSSLTPQLGFDNPDNAFSEVPYEKGYFFLNYLSSIIGNDMMIKFLNIYTVTFKFQSISVQDFLDLFRSYCAENQLDISQVDWDQWIKRPGLPPILPNMTTQIYEDAMDLAQQYLEKQQNINTQLFDTFFSSVKVLFINRILDNCDNVDDILSVVERIDNDYQIGQSNDPEIKCAWQQLAIKSLYFSQQSNTLENIDQFMSNQGRMKYLKPIYKGLMDTKDLKYIQFAKDLFEKNRNFYHPLAIQQVQAIVYPNNKKLKKSFLSFIEI